MSDRPLLELVGVGKRYGRSRWVLRNLDWQLSPGRLIGVAAVNGAGKSTLLRLLAGASRPSAGRIGQRPAATRYVPDRMAAHGRLPALSYLIHMGRLQGLSTTDARHRAGELLTRFALDRDPRAEVRQLSKGNAQKVLLAQAWLTAPELLILDEPWSALDEPGRAVLNELLAETVDRGGTVVFTDHQGQAGLGAQELYWLADGQLQRRAGRIAAAERAEVVLVGDAETALDWSTLANVVSADAEGETVTLQVSVDGLSRLLTASIAAGWAVHRVERRER